MHLHKNIKRILPAIAIVIITIAVYSPISRNGFIENWDDSVHILDNSDLQGISIENAAKWFSKGYLGTYMPVCTFTFALNYALGHYDPLGYHLLNLFLFILVSILVWSALFTLTKDHFLSILFAIFFAVHPFAAEPINWVSARISLLAMLFIMAAINYYLSGGRNWIILFLLYLLATLSKINAIVLPLLLLAIDFSQGNRSFTSRNLSAKIGMMVLMSPVLIYSLTLRGPVNHISPLVLISETPVKFLWYINHLLPMYSFSPVYNTPAYMDLRNLFGLFFIAGTIYLYNRSEKKVRELILMGGLFFTLSVAPHMIQFSFGSPVADRYGFISIFGLILILAAWFKQLGIQNRHRTLAVVTILIICLVYAFQSFTYTKKWRNANILWSHAVDKQPKSVIAHSKFGSWLYLNGDFIGAREQLIFTVSLDPENKDAYYNLGSLSYYSKAYNDAVSFFTKVYELEKDEAVLLDRARSYYEMGEYGKATLDLDKYLIKYPNADGFFLRGQSKLNAGLDGCSDIKLALDMGKDDALPVYARYCLQP